MGTYAGGARLVVAALVFGVLAGPADAATFSARVKIAQTGVGPIDRDVPPSHQNALPDLLVDVADADLGKFPLGKDVAWSTVTRWPEIAAAFGTAVDAYLRAHSAAHGATGDQAHQDYARFAEVLEIRKVRRIEPTGATPPPTSPPTTTATTRPPATLPPGTAPTTTRPRTSSTTRPTTTTLPMHDDEVPPMVMPTARMLTMGGRIPVDKVGLFVEGADGVWRTSMQPERIAAAFLLYKYRAAALLYDRYSEFCTGVINRGEYRDDNEKLRKHYWSVQRDDEMGILNRATLDPYAHAQRAATALRRCVLKHERARREAAQSVYMTGDLLDWLDLRIEAGQVAAGGRFAVTVPGVEDKRLAMIGLKKFSDRVGARDNPIFVDLIRRIVAAHHTSDENYCYGTATPHESVSALTAAILTTPGLTPDQRWMGLMVFVTQRDEGPKGYPRQVMCDLKILEGIAMHAWAACLLTRPDYRTIDPVTKVEQPNAAECAEFTFTSHGSLHEMGGNRLDLNYRFGNHTLKPQITAHKPRSLETWLACFVDDACPYRPTWIPPTATWRIIVSQPAGAM